MQSVRGGIWHNELHTSPASLEALPSDEEKEKKKERRKKGKEEKENNKKKKYYKGTSLNGTNHALKITSECLSLGQDLYPI